jgi:hypothetical protein
MANWTTLVAGESPNELKGRKGKETSQPASLNVQTGIVPYENGMAMADAWNHHVLIWHHFPEENNAPPDLVLGQKTFKKLSPTKGNLFTSRIRSICPRVFFIMAKGFLWRTQKIDVY